MACGTGKDHNTSVSYYLNVSLRTAFYRTYYIRLLLVNPVDFELE